MPYTGADILNEVENRFPDYDRTNMGATDLQKAHDWVLSAVRLYADQSEDLTLVASQKEYTYNVNTLAIWLAVYRESATDDGYALLPLSADQLDQDIPTWRTNNTNNEGTPAYVCDRGGQVILYPAPQTATSGGYPTVTLYSSRAQTLASATNLPSFVRQIDAWADYICYLFSKRQMQENAEYWLKTALMSRDQMVLDMNMVNYRAKQKVTGKKIRQNRV